MLILLFNCQAMAQKQKAGTVCAGEISTIDQKPSKRFICQLSVGTYFGLSQRGDITVVNSVRSRSAVKQNTRIVSPFIIVQSLE